MATLTIRNLDDALVKQIKIRAATNGRSMEEEVRRVLDQQYRDIEQLQKQRKAAARLRLLHQKGRLPKSDSESIEIIHQMRDERSENILKSGFRRDGDR